MTKRALLKGALAIVIGLLGAGLLGVSSASAASSTTAVKPMSTFRTAEPAASASSSSEPVAVPADRWYLYSNFLTKGLCKKSGSWMKRSGIIKDYKCKKRGAGPFKAWGLYVKVNIQRGKSSGGTLNS